MFQPTLSYKLYQRLAFYLLLVMRLPALDRGFASPSYFVNSRLGYYIREGKHAMTAGEWRVFLEYADRHLR